MGNSFEILWEGIVRLDKTFDDLTTNIIEASNSKKFVIKDVKYQHSIGDVSSFPWVTTWREINQPISVQIIGNKSMECMKCTAQLEYHGIKRTTGVFKKKTHIEKQPIGYTFILEPYSGSEKPQACLASYHARIGRDNAFQVHNKGHVAFFSGSQSAQYSGTSAYFSITSVFIASDINPFEAFVRKKGMTYKMRCTLSGIDEICQDRDESAKPLKKSLTKKKDDPISILKIRLAKGEISIEEYAKLKGVLE